MTTDVTQQKEAETSLATRLRQQAVVAQLSQTALSRLDLQTLFDQASDLIAESLEVTYCKILELLPDQRSLIVRAGTGWQPGIVGSAIVDADANSQAGYTLQSKQPIIVKDLATDPRFQGPPLLADHGVVSGMSTIIAGEGDRPFGILGAHSTQQRTFTQDDVHFLQAIANLLSAAISRERTETELSHLNQTLEERIRDRTRALEAANQELESFSYSIAHDLRAPLRAIQGFARVLQEDYGNALDQLGQTYIARMAGSAEQLDALIQDLLTYSQLGRTEITLRRVEIAPLLADILDSLEPQIAAEQADLAIASDLPSVYAHRNILRQVLFNLLLNALKFVAPGVKPQIQIGAAVREIPSASPSDSMTDGNCRVRIWIRDNGIGIAPRHQDRIFRPFERLHGAEVYPGTGIGLSIVQRGVQRMGGTVGLESTENQGSCFWIELSG